MDFNDTFNSMIRKKDYLLILHNDTLNPSQTQNLLDTKYLKDQTDENALKIKCKASILHNQIRKNSWDLDIIRTKLPMLNPIAIGLITICINLISNSENQELLLDNRILNIFQSLADIIIWIRLFGQMALQQTNKFLINPNAFIINDQDKLNQQINDQDV